MRLYLADPKSRLGMVPLEESPYFLQAFPIINAMWPILEGCKAYMVDSGAFRMLRGKVPDVEGYLKEYARTIREREVEQYFELDLDSILPGGWAQVKRMTDYLSQEVGRDPIPVWHRNRGKEGWIEMCERYDYVSIGGIALKELPLDWYKKAIPWFVETAHERGCRVHGLGFTPQIFSIHGLDSVDSTSWVSGTKFGKAFEFRDGKITGHSDREKRAKAEINVHNFREWVKYQKWAEVNL